MVLAMGFTCVTVGGDTRCLTMDAAASGTARHDASIPGEHCPSCAETSPLPSLYTGAILVSMAGEDGACHEPDAGQPPTTPWVST
jgi:hypothetical protein